MLRLGRTLIHTACLLPLIWLGYQLIFGDITRIFAADPIKELLHFLGLTALYIFSALFALRIISRLYRADSLLPLHKTLGLWGLFWLALHIFSYLALELAFDYSLFLSEILQRPYLLLGALAFLLFVCIAASSMPFIRHKLGRYWFLLHQLTHLAILLAIIHYYWSTKGNTLQPLFFLVFAVILIIWKLFGNRVIGYKNKTR